MPEEETIIESPDETPQEGFELGEGVSDEETLDPREAALATKIAELEKKEAALKDFERKVNARSTELGAIAKQLEQSKPVAPVDDGIDDDTKKEMRKLLKGIGLDPDEVTNVIAMAKRSTEEAREEAFNSFVSSHDDVDAEKLVYALMDSGVDPNSLSPAALKRELDKTYKVVKAESIDPEAIAKKAVADYLANLKKQGVDESDIVEVKKGRSSATGAHRSVDDVMADKSLTFIERQTLMDKLSGVIS